MRVSLLRIPDHLNPKRRLGTRLTLDAVITVLLLSLALSALAGYISRKQLKHNASQTLNESAFQMADKLDRGMFERVQDVEILAQMEVLSNLKVEIAEKRTLLERLQQSYPDYAWIGFARVDGSVVVGTKEILESRQVSQRSWFKGAQTSTFVGDVHEAFLLETLLPKSSNSSSLNTSPITMY